MNDQEKPYSRHEILTQGDKLPSRGLLCPKCGMRIPQFVDLTIETEARIRNLLVNGRNMMATRELIASTNCSITWAKLWVAHSGNPDVYGTTAPCPFCGKDLKTARAKQCQHCLMDWHHPDNPKSLRDISLK